MSTAAEDFQDYLEGQASDFASKFPSESFESPKATSYPHKSGIIDKLLHQKLSPSMNGKFKLAKQVQLKPAKSTTVDALMKSLVSQSKYLPTPEKKEKYNAVSKALATKLAFKNLKKTLF